MIPFFENRELRRHTDLSGNWQAELTGNRTIIFNKDGWRYSYKAGALLSVLSPTERSLNFKYRGDVLQTVEIRDARSGKSVRLVSLKYDRERKLTALEIQGVVHDFAYVVGKTKPLMHWKRPTGEIVTFQYRVPGILVGLKEGERNPISFRSEFVKSETNKSDAMAKRDPASYWLFQDDQHQYAYGTAPNTKITSATEITLTDASGVERVAKFSPERGLLEASHSAAPDEKITYYRAPGQRYDGKLRRLERGGRLVTEHRYDRKTGLIARIIDANGQSTFFEYPDVPGSRKGRTKDGWDIKSIRVRKGTERDNRIVEEVKYDKAGRVVATKNEAGVVREFAYSKRGDLTGLREDGGIVTSFWHDGFGRVVAVERDEARETVEYDGFGRVVAQTGADGVEVEFERGKGGEIEKVLRGGELASEILRDERERPVGEMDALGRVRSIERDVRGNVIAETAPGGVVTRYEYDDRDLRTAQIDGNGNRIELDYDSAGRLTKQTNPIKGVLTWEYDADGKLVERTNGEQTIRYRYGKNDRPELIDYGSGQTIQYAYDDEGRITTAATPTTQFQYAYDALGRTEMTRAIRGDEEQLVRFQYDATGRRTGLLLAELTPAVAPRGNLTGRAPSYEVRAQIDYTYNAGGRLESITCNGRPVAAYRHDTMGRLAARTYGNGMTAAITYDPRGRLAGVGFTGGPLGEDSTFLGYEWDAANQVTRRAWNGEIQRYEYDPSGQLLRVLDDTGGSTLEEYAYDKAGNMLRKTVGGRTTAMTYNAANQLTSVASASLPMDSSTSQSPKPGEAVAYHYDKAGRMLGAEGGARSAYGWLDKVVVLTTEDGRKIDYEYWPDGQLAVK